MARVTLTMDEALWLRAREAASSSGESLSRFVAESVERWLDRTMVQGGEVGVPAAPLERSTSEEDVKSGYGRRSDDGSDA